MENVKIEAGRINTGHRKNSYWSALYLELKCEPYYKRGERQTPVLFYKIVFGIALPYVKDLILSFKPPQHGYNHRNVGNFNFVMLQSMTFTYYESLLSSSVQLCNNLLRKQSVMSGVFLFFKNVVKQFVELTKKKS